MLASAASIVIAFAVLGLDSDGAWSTSLRLLGGAGGATVARARPVKQAPDGVTLKSTAPIPLSPTNNQPIGSVPTPALICTVATGRFVSSTFEYHFEVWAIAADGTTTLVETGTAQPSTDRAIYSIRSALGDGGYTWRVRAELAGFVGPWSTWATFVAQSSWTLLYAEDFSTPLNGAVAPWVWDGDSNPFDTIMDDRGLWYQNDYGPNWNTAFNSFATYRKEFPAGQDGWLTASLSGRDWDKDGVIDDPPSICPTAPGSRIDLHGRSSHRDRAASPVACSFCWSRNSSPTMFKKMSA